MGQTITLTATVSGGVGPASGGTVSFFSGPSGGPYDPIADFAPISQLQLMRFKGERWQLFGDVISADVGG